MNKEKQKTKKEHEQKKPDPKDLKIKELTDLLKHTQAEFENYQKRIDRDKQQIIKCAGEDLVKELLPIIDNFERALQQANKDDEFVKGTELIINQLLEILKAKGLEEVNAEGIFNPNIHEALLQEESEKKSGTIIQVLEKGYLFNGKLLRAVKVKVAK